jgi:hypothetical protein
MNEPHRVGARRGVRKRLGRYPPQGVETETSLSNPASSRHTNSKSVNTRHRARHRTQVPDQLVCFRERCSARALLVAEGVLDLLTAVDELQAAAERTGLIDRIGQDAVQAIMSAAFDGGAR